jgi:tRNA threonylcarbamoyl adenosine modification protein YeaZ
MNILALEFSSAQRSVAILSGDGHSSDVHEVTDAGGKGTRAFSLITEALSLAKVQRKEIDCLAVALGPGSYTGIRVAISIAQGWQLATEQRTAGISTVDVLATQAQEKGSRGEIEVIVDAQRGELYWTRYTVEDEWLKIMQPLRLAQPQEVKSAVNNEQQIIGPEAGAWFPGATPMFPSAAVLAKLALAGRSFVPAQMLEPVYLRETTFIKAPRPRIV